MIKSISERRLAENQVVFRQYNESVQKGFDDLVSLAKETDQTHMINIDDNPLHFYCECSDENCRKRLQLKPSRYNEIHKRRDRFVIICGHEVASIERVVQREADCCVVQKNKKPPQTASGLNITDVNNS